MNSWNLLLNKKKKEEEEEEEECFKIISLFMPYLTLQTLNVTNIQTSNINT